VGDGRDIFVEAHPSEKEFSILHDDELGIVSSHAAGHQPLHLELFILNVSLSYNFLVVALLRPARLRWDLGAVIYKGLRAH
jgi:hypothetical protein